MTEINGTNTGLTFKVMRHAPELICPANPTPYEFKELSNLDNNKGLRVHLPFILFYKNHTSNINSSLRGFDDPAKVIKDAIAKALVSYYPIAGRLRETGEGKLVVECNGKGVLFIEGDADVTLDDFGHPLHPPFPCSDELLYGVPVTSEILHSSLLIIQVTRLKCGGFIFALSLNHAMTDGIGLVQFLNAVTELAGGAQHPSIPPVWMRHLLSDAPGPSQGSYHEDVRYEYNCITSPLDELVHKSFFFGSAEIARLQESVSPSTTFELIIAHLWRCHTMALYSDPQETVQLTFVMNTRSKYNPSLPTGYYGNVIAVPIAQATTAELSENPFQYIVDLVKRTKENVNVNVNVNVNEEYVKSLANRMAVGRFTVSDHRRIGLNCLDFGWGRPVYGGFGRGSEFNPYLGYITCFTPFKHLGKSGVLVPICLPRSAMEKFVNLVSLV
ncbi:benzyl alcohol O-benzoyltransferase-like [Silene latifolia]|uniref:benzyl alcohol O-benzoyltransferase-like n=1 Tax=Silene latifolia TaxID=37657 RepID=UPI003D789373